MTWMWFFEITIEKGPRWIINVTNFFDVNDLL